MTDIAKFGCAVGAILIIIAGIFWAWPQYRVWQQGLAGEAELKRATQNRQIKIEEAEAFKASAQLYADAEVIRAGGVKQANDIIAEGLGGPEGYLRYLFIQQLGENDSDIIYLPTEAGIPILEAKRLKTED